MLKKIGSMIVMGIMLFAGANAFAWGLGGVSVTCSNDYGVKDMGKQINSYMFNAYVASENALAHTMDALGQKKDADKIRVQLKDLKKEKAPKNSDALKTIESNSAKIKEMTAKAKTKKIDAEGKKSLAQARGQYWVMGVNLTIASIIAVPVGINAKKAIDANKVCATSLAPVAKAATTLIQMIPPTAKSVKAFQAFSKKAGLKPMTKAEKKDLMKNVKVPDSAKGKLGI